MHLQKLRACQFSELSTGTIAAYLKQDVLYHGMMVELGGHKWFLEFREPSGDPNNSNMYGSSDINTFPFISFPGSKIIPRLEPDKIKLNGNAGNCVILFEDTIFFSGGTKQQNLSFNLLNGKYRDLKSEKKLYCYSWDIVAPDLNSTMISIKKV